MLARKASKVLQAPQALRVPHQLLPGLQAPQAQLAQLQQLLAPPAPRERLEHQALLAQQAPREVLALLAQPALRVQPDQRE